MNYRNSYLVNIITFVLFIFTLIIGLYSEPTSAAEGNYSQGFETDTSGWTGTLSRVSSGTNGIPSSGGDWHAITSDTIFTFWGGSDSTWPENGYTTEIDVYLDMSLASGTDSNQFQWNSAINDTSGVFLEEAFFQARTDPSLANQWNVRLAIVGPDGFDPQPWINVTETSWYTFRHTFSEDDSGLLQITLELVSPSGGVVTSHTFGGYSEYMVNGGSGNVGGNRYGWFSTNEFTDLPIDNAEKINTIAAGLTSPAPITDGENTILVGYWDLRNRDSFFQVTNTSGENARVHIQLFNTGNECDEFDYFDTLTSQDTHVYNVSDLDRNHGNALSSPTLIGGHGIVAVTLVDESNTLRNDKILTGNFRIIDSSGYEYRTNFAGSGIQLDPGEEEYKANFNNLIDTSQSDLVVISYELINSPGGIIPTTQTYNVVSFDNQENAISCPHITLGCSEGSINSGINQSISNSRGGPTLCLGTDSTGFIKLGVQEADPETDALIMYLGLNDGNGIGSIDSVIHSEND